MNTEQAFGLSLRNVRTTHSLSQEQLAEKSGLHRTYVSQLERGLKSPSLSTLFRLAAAFGIPPHQLIQRTETVLLESSNETGKD